MNIITNYTDVYLLLKKSRSLCCVLFLFFSLQVYSQTYTLPDTALRNKLQASYPAVMSGGQLNITAAGNFTGILNLSFSSITNAEGLQYFTSVSHLFLNNNKLTTLPDISGLTNLIDFQVQYNKLTNLPSFSGNTNLLNIYCQHNKITTLPDISMLTNLKILHVGENNLGQLPDLSPLTNLEQLHVHLTGIDTIIGLSSLTKLEELFAWGNHIRDLSGLSNNTTLKLFQVFNNDLKSLPVLSNKPALTSASFIYNYLTAEDLLPLAPLSNFNLYDYKPQKQFALSVPEVREKNPVAFSLNIDPTITDNQYTWYKNGSIVATNQTGIFSINAAAYSDSGTYYVQVTNPGLPGLTLYSDSAMLKVTVCMELKNLGTELLSEHCNEGSNIQWTNLNLEGGTTPFVYGLINISRNDTLFSTDPRFQNVAPGLYQAVITDANNCVVTHSVSIKKPEDCQSIISPNGDGIADFYYIEESGTARIYDIRRRLIKELSIPGEWDGRKSDQSFADDGYYAIVINEKKTIHITLVK